LYSERIKLQKKINILERCLEETEEKYVDMCIDLVDLRKATCGHTPENVATIMEAAPSAGELEGRSFTAQVGYRYTHASKVEYFFSHIVEYLENDEITDAMVVAAGGRVPCEVRWAEGDEPEKETLLMVRKSTVTQRFVCRDMNYAFCRIKKSDLKEI